MRLLEIYSAEENNWIKDKIDELGFRNDDFWTGGVYSDPWPQFKWNFVNEIEFENWADGEPGKGSSSIHCISLTAATDYKWSSVQCIDIRNYFLCKDIVRVDSNAMTDNTFMFTGKKYHFKTTSKTNKYEASSYCYEKDMTMLSIVTKEENDWIVCKIRELGFSGDDFWTGGWYSSLNEFSWSANTDMVTFTNWADGQPKKVDDHLSNCLALTASIDFKWTLKLCQFDLCFVVCKERFP